MQTQMSASFVVYLMRYPSMIFRANSSQTSEITCEWDTHMGCGKARGWRLSCDRCCTSPLSPRDYSTPMTRWKEVEASSPDMLRALREVGGV